MQPWVAVVGGCALGLQAIVVACGCASVATGGNRYNMVASACSAERQLFLAGGFSAVMGAIEALKKTRQ